MKSLTTLLSPKPAGIASILLFSIILSTSLVAAPKHGDMYDQWEVLCNKVAVDKKKLCRINQYLTDTKNKGFVLNVAVSAPKSIGAKPLLIITTPLGVLLKHAIAINIDKAKPTKVSYDLCHNKGCIARKPLDSSTILAMKRGNLLNVNIATRQGRVVRIPVSLSGFTASYNAL